METGTGAGTKERCPLPLNFYDGETTVSESRSGKALRTVPAGHCPNSKVSGSHEVHGHGESLGSLQRFWLQGDGEPAVVGSRDGPSCRAKFSKGKVTDPGRKQIFRVSGLNGNSSKTSLLLTTNAILARSPCWGALCVMAVDYLLYPNLEQSVPRPAQSCTISVRCSRGVQKLLQDVRNRVTRRESVN
jgi:hypothetical protein